MKLTKAPSMLIEALDKYDWTQRKLAAAAGVSTKHISQLATGRVPFNPFMAVKIETVLPPFKADEVLHAQTDELVEAARKLFKNNNEAASGALDQPAMFEIEEVTG